MKLGSAMTTYDPDQAWTLVRFTFVTGIPVQQTKELTLANLRRTIAFTMLAGFDTAFRKVQKLVADFKANGKFQDYAICRCDGLNRQIDALVSGLYALTPDELKIVAEAAR